ncbi:MAG TPA: hypothetical protein VJ756_11570 [Terriglobales bacterium]|nr:hypothetical protein [Terriglobales bacterium]
MRLTTLILLIATFITVAAAQKQQANQPSEPGAQKSRRARKEKQAATSGTAPAAAAQQAEGEAKGPWKALQYRLIGPFRGGRVVAVSGVVGEPNTFYFGAVAGGVWKTTDGGLNWTPLTDKEKGMSPSIGALAVSESNPNVIYAGSGEACIRGNIVGGNGVYKSIDAGKTWKSVGLSDTHAIGRIIVDPKNPNRVFVAALGHPFADNEERGIFRSLDGGKTWQKVLYKDAKSGGIDITFAPSNPNLLFAALWETQRTPWNLDSGGPGSGLYRSSDGGDTWKELTGHGLPDGPLGRIGVTVSGGNPNRVWAVIEANKGGIYRSDDGGDTWQLMTDDHRFRQRAWYYSHIFADPKSEDTVYILNTGVYRSHDGGKTFARIPAPHGDNHALWIDPNNPDRLINGNDGGATISVDGGKTWSTEYNQPTAQFYHVTTDNRFPYYIYGAQQDNSTVGIASASPDGAIDRPDWYDVGGGESGYIAPDPTDPQIVYAGSYGGEITRYDHRTGQLQGMNPWPVNPIGWGAADLKHRFQWTEPIVFSPHDHTMYFAGEVLFKTTNGGMSWTIISPDLTRNDKSKQQSSGGPITKDNTGVEVYDTIFSVVESPVQRDLIWAGSDDGLVHLTRDGGQHWENVTPKAMPEWGTVSMIEASPRDAGTAYMAVERHKMDDFAPYIFKTTDFGKTWTSLVSGIPADDYVHAVRIDPRRPDLLFAGTEKGMYVSFDNGAKWQPLQMNLPPSPVNDLVIKNDDLIVATHGRSFWVLDDITPLEQYSDSIAQEDVHLFTPAPAGHTIFRRSFFELSNVGKNPPEGAVIDYWLKTAIKPEEKKKDEAEEQGAVLPEKPAPKITLEILDASGKVIRKFPPKEEETPTSDEPYSQEHKPGKLTTDAGLNRFVWDQRYEGAAKVAHAPIWGGDTRGPEAVPGRYQVRLTVLEKSFTAPLEIKADPRLNVNQADLQKQFDLLMKIRDKLSDIDNTINQIRDLRSQIRDINKRLKDDPRQKAIADAGKVLDKKMTTVEEALIQTKSKSSQDVLNFPIRLNNQMAALGGVVGSAASAPTQQSYEVFDMLTKQVDEQLTNWKNIVSTDVKSYDDAVRQQNVPALILLKPEKGE